MPVVADLEMASSYLYVLHLFAAVTVIWILTHSIVTPLTSEELKDLGWKPRKKMEETLLDSIEYYEKAGLLQDVEGRPCRLPHLFHMAIEK
jgi:hypothetical protein